MKKLAAIALCLVLTLSFAGCSCGGEEEAALKAEDVHEIITYYCETNGKDGNYINSYVDTAKNVVVVEMKDISEERQNEFIYSVFAGCTGSIYIKTLKEQSMLEFAAK